MQRLLRCVERSKAAEAKGLENESRLPASAGVNRSFFCAFLTRPPPGRRRFRAADRANPPSCDRGVARYRTARRPALPMRGRWCACRSQRALRNADRLPLRFGQSLNLVGENAARDALGRDSREHLREHLMTIGADRYHRFVGAVLKLKLLLNGCSSDRI